MNISPLAPKVPTYPAVGDRIGVVYGPSGFPADNPGTVVRVYSDRWQDHIADVQMDDGTPGEIIGAYTAVGIGAYLIERPTPNFPEASNFRKTGGFPIGSIRAAVAARGDAWTYQLAPKPMHSNHRICECEDYWGMAWCTAEIQTKGRAASMQRRAFSAIDDNEDDLMEVAA